jgi:TIR domain
MSLLLRLWRFALAGPRRITDALFGYDFFLSYAHADGEEYPRALDAALKEKYTVHLDTRDYHAGKDLRVLTRLRVRNSRLLVVVGRPLALTRSYWVRREVEMFHEAGREPVVIDVDGAVEAALAAPPKDSLAAWLAAHREIRADGAFIDPFLLEVDAAQLLSVGGPRLPQQHVIQRLQERFTGDRVETRRLRTVTGALVVLLLALTVAVWQTGLAESRRKAAVNSLAQATSNELAARARVTAMDRPDLALVLATESLDTARAGGVSWTEGASALRDIMSETRGTRQYCLQRGEGRSIDFSEALGLLAVATDAGAVCLFRRDDGNALRLLDTLQSFSGGGVEVVRFSADGEWLITQMRDGPLRALPAGAIYRNARAVQHGQANYKFEAFGETDVATALSFDAEATHVAFFSAATEQVEIWNLLSMNPPGAPSASFEPGGHVLATAFDPTGTYIAALVAATSRNDERAPVANFGRPDRRDFGKNPSLRVKVWRLSGLMLARDFPVLERKTGIFLGDGIAMGALHGMLRLGPLARWAAPAVSLADTHSLEPRMIAQIVRVSNGNVVASFMNGPGENAFDGWRRISDIGFTKDGSAFFALNDSVVRFWSLETTTDRGSAPQRVRELITPSARSGARKAQGVVSAVVLSADDRLLATLDSTDSLAVWDVAGGLTNNPTEPWMFVEGFADVSPGTPTAVRFSRNSREVFFATSNGEVRACDVKNRCGSILPRRASAPSSGSGQWKSVSVPDHGMWVAAVSEKQVVSFFRPSDISTPFLSVPVSDVPAPVVSRGYAILSGTPGRPVAVVSSADGAWAAVFEQQQYGYHRRLRLVRLTGPGAVLDVGLKSEKCDGRFARVEFDRFAPYVVVLSHLGCIAVAKLPDAGTESVVAQHPLRLQESGLELPSLTFTKHYILIADHERGQLWSRDAQSGGLGRLLLAKADGQLLLSSSERYVFFVPRGGVSRQNGVVAYPLTTERALGEHVAIGEYSAVATVALGANVSVIVGTRDRAIHETVSIWRLDEFTAPLVEQPFTSGKSEPIIVFDPSETRILVGPTRYSLKEKRPEPRIMAAVLFEIASRTPRLTSLNIDNANTKEDCSSSGPEGVASCFELGYVFSPNAAWLAVSRTQSFGPPGSTTIWELGARPAPRLTFARGSEVEFDRTSEWLMAATEGEQRLWRVAANSGAWVDQGRVGSRGFSWFMRNSPRVLLLTSGEFMLQPLEVGELVAHVPDFIGRNLSPREWEALFSERAYEQRFPTIPSHAERVFDLVNHGEILAKAGRGEEAWQTFGQAARLATEIGSVHIANEVVSAALEIGCAGSISAALEFATRVLPKDREVQGLRQRVMDASAQHGSGWRIGLTECGPNRP